MNRRNLLLAAMAFALLPGAGKAHEARLGDLVIEHPWARATAQTRPGAGYLTIRNTGAAADRLIGIETAIAERAEPHAHVMENDIAKMARVEAVDVPAGGTAAFAPHGYHIMFMGLKRPLAKGDTFAATLVFEKSGRVEVIFETQAAGATGPDPHEP